MSTTTSSSCTGSTCTNDINLDNTLTKLPIFTDLPILDISAFLVEPTTTTSNINLNTKNNNSDTTTKAIEEQYQVLANEIKKAIEISGFFMVQGHGININALLQQAQRFFELPLSIKKEFVPNLNSGYHSIGDENLNPDTQIYGGDFKEVVDFAEEFLNPLDPSLGQPFRPKNHWPEESQLPEFKTKCIQFQEQFRKVGEVLFKALALAMQQNLDFFDHLPYPQRLITFRMAKYPPPNYRMTEARLSCAAHSDYGCLTLLAMSGPGLQLRLPQLHCSLSRECHAHPMSKKYTSEHGCWVQLPFMPHTLMVNVGDMVSRWTNRTFPSTLHRVVHVGHEPRYSIAFFYDVDPNNIIQVLPEFQPTSTTDTGATSSTTTETQTKESQSTELSNYLEPLKFGDYLLSMFQSTFRKF